MPSLDVPSPKLMEIATCRPRPWPKAQAWTSPKKRTHVFARTERGTELRQMWQGSQACDQVLQELQRRLRPGQAARGAQGRRSKRVVRQAHVAQTGMPHSVLRRTRLPETRRATWSWMPMARSRRQHQGPSGEHRPQEQSQGRRTWDPVCLLRRDLRNEASAIVAFFRSHCIPSQNPNPWSLCLSACLKAEDCLRGRHS